MGLKYLYHNNLQEIFEEIGTALLNQSYSKINKSSFMQRREQSIAIDPNKHDKRPQAKKKCCGD